MLEAIAGLVLTAALLQPPALQPPADRKPEGVGGVRAAAFPDAIGAHLGRSVHATRPASTSIADLAIRCVRIEGLQRAALVAVTTAGLLLGVSPMPWPSRRLVG